ncbi:glycoside hydrolase family 20 zincin-like fold domain-containing protein, partial [Acidobacteria bacterium AH-259-G07]|nr:glycoside hydrolase family 20 zincin-like fold domain-containing protein [Acidobacteria bacterium AH-259-G07]
MQEQHLTRLVTAGLLALFAGPLLEGAPRLIPTPHYQAWGKQVLRLEGGSDPVQLVLMEGASAKEELAAELIRSEAEQLSAGRVLFRKRRVGGMTPRPRPAAGVYLTRWSRDGDLQNLSSVLDEEDRQLLSDPEENEQGFVLRILPEKHQIWLIGATSQAVLYAAVTLLQVMEPAGDGLAFQEAHIRDYPDFRYRAASDWLLFAEINRWAYDWGDGRRAFVRRIKRKLDFCLRYKINLVFFDGFGWNAEKFPGYSTMMRELNRYARDRGIKLLFAGYGANYNPRAIRPEHNIGKVWYNRDQYPDGNVYACFGETTRGGVLWDDPRRGTLGTCRGNEELNRLKAAEMTEFVRSVEPGALYIHHEDRGIGDPHLPYHLTNYELWETWKRRCDRCRSRWPSDSLITKDGGAGAVAHGYKTLLEAIRNVKNNDSGYDASRDCTIIFTSPGYNPSPTEPSDWENHLIFWTNVLSLLPPHENLEIGFREVFPQQGTGKRWVDAYRERLGAQGLNTRTCIFFLGGADLYSRNSFNYPFSGTAAMNGIFRGGETIYNFSGAVFQEPLQLFNAEFSWNVRAPGHMIPERYEEAKATWQSLMNNRQLPEEITRTNGFLAEACRKLYGKRAGEKMLAFFTTYRTQPRVEVPAGIGSRIMQTHSERTVDEVYG